MHHRDAQHGQPGYVHHVGCAELAALHRANHAIDEVPGQKWGNQRQERDQRRRRHAANDAVSVGF